MADDNGPDPFVASTKLLLLLASLVFLLGVVPMLSGTDYSRVLWRGGMTCVIVFAAIATTRRKAFFLSFFVAAAVATPANWMTLAIESRTVFLISSIVESAFFATMAVLILIAVTSKHLATINSVYGAFCSYLLFGLGWAILYLGVADSSDGSLSISGLSTEVIEQGEVAAFSQLIYFSFVTMSTLGYGDFVPTTPLVRTMAWMQSVCGQFYIAVIVAWLVSEIPRRKAPKENKRPADGSVGQKKKARREQT